MSTVTSFIHRPQLTFAVVRKGNLARVARV
jgi:hypothetical protein